MNNDKGISGYGKIPQMEQFITEETRKIAFDIGASLPSLECNIESGEHYPTATQTHLSKWLREDQNVVISISGNESNKSGFTYNFNVTFFGRPYGFSSHHYSEDKITWEDALEMALLYVVKEIKRYRDFKTTLPKPDTNATMD